MRIKWKNVIAAIVLIASLGLILHDLMIVVFSPVITGKLIGYTWYGIATNLVAVMLMSISYEWIKKELAKTSSNK